MITQYGMSPVLGPVAYGESSDHQVFLGRDLNNQRNYSEDVASEIDKEVRKYIEEAYEACRKLLEDNIDKLHAIAEALIEKETLDGDELQEILGDGEFNVTRKGLPPEDDDNDDTSTPLVTPIEEPAEIKVMRPENQETAVKNPQPEYNSVTND